MSREAGSEDRLSNYFAMLEAKNPASMQLFVADDEVAFIAAVEFALNAVIVRLESGAKKLMALDEETLSWMLVNDLRAADIDACAEAYHNGHVDVLIRHPRLHFASIGECKLHNGYEYHVGGCKQLLFRYSSGRSRRGFCLDFFQVPGMYAKLEKLRDNFRAKKPLNQQGDPVAHGDIKGAFVSSHVHDTKAVVEILHVGCNSYHSEVKPPRVVSKQSSAGAVKAKPK